MKTTRHAEERQKLERKAKVEISPIYNGKVFDIHLDKIFVDREKPISRAFINHNCAVGMLPIIKDQFILVKQYRRAVDEIVLEIPAGIIEKGEPPIETAQRELQEEIGYKSNNFTPIGGFYTSPGYCNEYLYLFLAHDLEISSLDGDDDEAIDIVYISHKEALNYILENKIKDAKTLVAILRYFAWINA